MLDLQSRKKKQIIKGGDNSLTVRLQDECGDAFDISSATEILVYLPTSTGGRLSKSKTGGAVSVLNGGGGKFQVSLPKADCQNLLEGSGIALEVHVIGATETVIQIPAAVDVLPALYGY